MTEQELNELRERVYKMWDDLQKMDRPKKAKKTRKKKKNGNLNNENV